MDYIKLLKRRIQKAKLNIKNKSPKDKCLFVQEWTNVLLRVFGIPILDIGYEPYWRSGYFGLIIGEALLLGVYTINYYAKKSDYMRCIPVLCLAGIAVPVNRIHLVRFIRTILQGVVKICIYRHQSHQILFHQDHRPCG